MSALELPRDNLFRAFGPGIGLREADSDPAADPGPPTMFGHFAVFNQWTEINSFFEGNFLERIAPGAFKKTIREKRDQIKVLFNHGSDPSIGDKPLGPLEEIHEDETGAYYEVPLLDTSYNRDLLPALEKGLLGASFRFRVLREEKVDDPGVSDENPKGLAERTVKELELYELGPVTFPAYADASSGVRSLTDTFTFERIARDPQAFRDLLSAGRSIAPSPDDAAPSGTSPVERREFPPITREEFLGWTPGI